APNNPRVGRGERIRTSDILLPKQALYQAEPRPDQGMARVLDGLRLSCNWAKSIAISRYSLRTSQRVQCLAVRDGVDFKTEGKSRISPSSAEAAGVAFSGRTRFR